MQSLIVVNNLILLRRVVRSKLRMLDLRSRFVSALSVSLVRDTHGDGVT